MKSREPNSLRNKPPLSSSFYLRETVEVARDLLGKGLYVRHGRHELLAEICEVEAYLGDTDPASHAFRGVTPRNRAMFESGGTCYVYLSYGVNWCMNVSTREKGIGQAVLLRAGVPLVGLEKMRQNRGIDDDRKLLNGPGKLCEGLGIDIDFNGKRFDRDDFKLIDLGGSITEKLVSSTPRIGISKAKDEPLRFCIKGSPWLSRKDRG